MTRADVILMIEFNALIRYRDSNGHERHGIVIGDSYSRFNGENTYTVTVKDPRAYSISGCYLDEIIEVIDWHIPQEYQEKVADMVRQQIINSYFKDGSPDYTYGKEEIA
jgi:hypothetical protein